MMGRLLLLGPLGVAAVGLIGWAVYRDRRAAVAHARARLACLTRRAMRHREEVPHA